MKNGFENPLEEKIATRPSATGRSLLFLENLRNIQGVLKQDEYENSGNSGEIKVDTDPNNKELMLVKTDTGALVSAEREIATERLSACVALFIQAEGFNYLIHLTPSTNLGYYYHRFSNQEDIVKEKIGQILKPLVQVADLSKCHVLIVGNEGDHSGGVYDQSNVSKAWARLKDLLMKAGLKDVIISEPIPLDEVSLYWNPQQPDILSVAGLSVDSGNVASAGTEKRQLYISTQTGNLIN